MGVGSAAGGPASGVNATSAVRASEDCPASFSSDRSSLLIRIAARSEVTAKTLSPCLTRPCSHSGAVSRIAFSISSLASLRLLNVARCKAALNAILGSWAGTPLIAARSSSRRNASIVVALLRRLRDRRVWAHPDTKNERSKRTQAQAVPTTASMLSLPRSPVKTRRAKLRAQATFSSFSGGQALAKARAKL